ncbi:hypothetical protein AKJ44_02235 [candidate division MSBL1 archaeon SCGC-AAA261F17]|uniref:Polymerase nucleotidyl transferase domain-containing protein n=1 Tax=candidate division MSBL1 archaeon SCGC-AAA261F17 TaxID=1698274 RepID=A0A133V5K8_9EURY|nr:hypothetical protein AKJ44_02235 [candidate division MSBL1 archaeon SCGC-AAA261F17]
MKQVKGNYKIEKALIFGSRARDDYLKESDVDILLVSSDFKGIRFPTRSARMMEYWNLDYGDPEFLCYTPKEFNQMKEKLTIVKTAVEEGVSVI